MKNKVLNYDFLLSTWLTVVFVFLIGIILSFYFAEKSRNDELHDCLNKMNDENQMILNENQILRNNLYDLKRNK